MLRFTLVSCSILALSACNPTTTGGTTGNFGTTTDLLSRYNNLSTINTTEFTPNADISAMTATASYSGVGNFSNGSSVFNMFLGAIDLDVAFGTGDITGTVGDFAEYNFSGTGYTLGVGTPGSLAITGNLGTDNESFTDGLTGRATGSLDGVSLAMDMDGNLLGTDADGMVLYFDDDVIFGAMGTGFAAK